MLKKVEDRISVDLENAEDFNLKSKVGAKLKSGNELEEWLES